MENEITTNAKISSLAEARVSIGQIVELIDSMLTWNDLSKNARLFLTDASNHLEKAGVSMFSAFPCQQP